jgi:hypothetical protein
MNNIRKIFSVFIHEKEYDVYSIEGKKHNGEDSNWWVYLSD